MYRDLWIAQSREGFGTEPKDEVVEQHLGYWEMIAKAVENNEFVKNTVSLDELYLDSYERYAQNRPDTSELADAINGGYSLP